MSTSVISHSRTPGLVRHGILLTIAGLAVGLVGCRSRVDPSDVSGRYIVSISDADLPATAVVDGIIPPRDPNSSKDSLTVIKLPILNRKDSQYETPFAQIEVSNSVVGPPNALAVSRD